MKICRKCNIEKVDDDFYKHKRSCKACCCEINKIWRLNNIEKTKTTSRNLYLKHKVESLSVIELYLNALGI